MRPAGAVFQWIGLGEHLNEIPYLMVKSKNHGFRLKFSLKPNQSIEFLKGRSIPNAVASTNMFALAEWSRMI